MKVPVRSVRVLPPGHLYDPRAVDLYDYQHVRGPDLLVPPDVHGGDERLLRVRRNG